MAICPYDKNDNVCKYHSQLNGACRRKKGLCQGAIDYLNRTTTTGDNSNVE